MSSNPLYFYSDLRAIDSALARIDNKRREGWVDYIVDEKDLRPYLALNLEDKQRFLKKFSSEGSKTEALWNSIKRLAEKIGNQDSILTQDEIQPFRERAYAIYIKSTIKGLKLDDGFLEFPSEVAFVPINYDDSIATSKEKEKAMNREGFVEGRHGIDIEKLVADAMKWRFRNGVKREASIITAIISAGQVFSLHPDDVVEANKYRGYHNKTHTDVVMLGIYTEERKKHFIGKGIEPWDGIYKHILFRMKGEPTTIVTQIVRNTYDPKALWDQSEKVVFQTQSRNIVGYDFEPGFWRQGGEGVFQVQGRKSNGGATITITPNKGVVEQRDLDGKTTVVERAKTPWRYDIILFSLGLPFPLSHYQDQLPTIVEETIFMTIPVYKIRLQNDPHAPTETCELYFSKHDYRFVGYQQNGARMAFTGSLEQDPRSGIRYASDKEIVSAVQTSGTYRLQMVACD